MDHGMDPTTSTLQNVSTPSNVESGRSSRRRPTVEPGQRHGGSNTSDPIPNNQPRPRNSKPRNRPKPPSHIPEGDNDNGVDQISTSEPRPSRRRNPGAESNNATSSRVSDANNTTRRQPPPAFQKSRRRHPSNTATTTTNNTATDPLVSTIPATLTSQSTVPENKPRKEGSRRSRFGAGLTQPEATDSATSPNKHKGKAVSCNREDDNLISTLIRGLTSAPYHDCPICFSSIRPDQAIWSCSPSIPLVHNPQQGPLQYCWTSFHIKCIRSWADKSVKDVAEAWRARGEPDKKGDWRCPGCQAKRDIVPSGYWCFCHSVSEPKPLRLATPHSCGKSCSRPRESGCGHPCPLQCHPGPCPPCQITTRPECYCPLKKVLAFRCEIDPNVVRNLSCGNICGRTLGCRKHKCEKVCHSGECNRCEVKDMARCWCGKVEKVMECGEGTEEQCFVEGQPPWMGRFSCDELCEKLFDCGIHKCEKRCHPPSSTPDPCPRSPSRITHCPCGRGTIMPNSSVDQSLYTFSSRANCTSPIPTCDSVCLKPNATCSHPCMAKCHVGPCPPCSVKILRPCRCGSTTRSLVCHEAYKSSNSIISGTEENDILCDRPCAALRACGRHQCRRICCPLASLANAGKKGRRRVAEDGPMGEEHGGLHECDLVCGKMLPCGNHKCEERDHKGTCRPCMRSSFEELVCTCGLTVYDPPIPCGTVMRCLYPCRRPAPPCGHPTTPHMCHNDTVSCPPCPFLATKLCACGKKLVPNVRCSLETEKVFCGTVCGKLMACGFHHCEKLCHNECGNCTAPCGKARKSCLPALHPCASTCHAPSACPETESCESLITLTCPCGHIRQSVLCGQTISRRSGHAHATPKCSNDCQIAKRNARLADALGINLEGRENKSATVATYNDELAGFARANPKFLALVEKTFADFISSEKRTNVLPHMPPDRRKFVHNLASVYRMDTQMVDQEPHRSVQVIRRIDTRVPTPLLSTFVTPPPSLGKLADFRALKGAQSSPSWRPTTAATLPTKQSNSWNPTQGSAPTQRGWTSVVASSASSASTSTTFFAPKPTSSLEALDSHITHSSTSPGAGSSLSRTVSPACFLTEPVPEDWEDDV